MKNELLLLMIAAAFVGARISTEGTDIERCSAAMEIDESEYYWGKNKYAKEDCETMKKCDGVMFERTLWRLLDHHDLHESRKAKDARNVAAYRDENEQLKRQIAHLEQELKNPQGVGINVARSLYHTMLACHQAVRFILYNVGFAYGTAAYYTNAATMAIGNDPVASMQILFILVAVWQAIEWVVCKLIFTYLFGIRRHLVNNEQQHHRDD